MKIKNLACFILGGLLFGLTGGCAHVALSEIPQTREGYNKALSNSDNQQFLLNVVRMHFGQTPYFVNVDNMVTQSSLSAGTGASQLTSNPYNFTNTGPFWTLNPVVSFTQSPTITYSPLQGTQFVSGMLTPITLDKLSLLLQSGWSTAEVLKLAVEQIGTLSNGTTALHPLSTLTPEQQEFNNFVDTLDQLDLEDKIDYGATKYKDGNAVVINMEDNQSAIILAKILHLSKPYHQLIFTRAMIVGDQSPENVIYVQTRSFFSMLNFLSKGVASGGDMDTRYGLKKIAATKTSGTGLTKGVFLVSESNKEPDNATAKIDFDGKWYYIANNDVISKSTLVLLRIIYSLQTGDLKANVPLITIPVK